MIKAFLAKAAHLPDNSLLLILSGLVSTVTAHAQNFTFFAEHVTGVGNGIVQIEIVNPRATTGHNYRVFFAENNGAWFYTVENVTTNTIPANQLPLGSTSPQFEGIQVTVSEGPPRYQDIIEVQYGNTTVDPPVHVFRPGDFYGRGGNNSTNEFTFVGGSGNGGYASISRNGSNEAFAAPFDYELHFDGNPDGRNVIVHSFTGAGTYFNIPFSLWNIGIGTPDDPSDDYQIIAAGFDDSGNPSVYDGGAFPADGGSGTMYDRIYFYALNRNIGSVGDINNDGRVDYDDFLQDIQNYGGDLSTVLRSRPYVGNEVISRFCLVSLNGDPNYLPPVGTTIRITTSKPLSGTDSYAFTTPRFGVFTNPTAISFGKVPADRPSTKPVKVINNYQGNISINAVAVTNPVFRVSQSAFTLTPGDSAVFEVTFAPTHAAVFEDTLTISSNDPFFPRYKMSLSGYGLPPSTGAISLLGQIESPGPGTTDVWGYVDPITGKEYALVGYGLFAVPPDAGLFIVDVTNPSNPVAVANVNTVPGFDVKTWQHYAYTVNGSSGGLGGIVDISNPENPRVVGSFPSSHNLFIDEKGYMYLECSGLRIFDLNPDPANPTLVWDDGTSACHDAAVIGDRLYDFHGSFGTNIYDVRDRANPALLGSIIDPTITYHHSGWPTEDGKYLFICDELATHPAADVTVWDISDVANPEKIGQFADPDATVHNLYIIGKYAYLSYYTAGFRVLDISDPMNPRLAEEYDTSLLSGEGFGGAFGAYVFTPSKNIYVSDEENGLFIFSFAGRTTGVDNDISDLPAHYALFDNYPNPFNPETAITYQLPKKSQVKLEIYDTLGRRIRTLVNAEQIAGRHKIFWDGRDDSQIQVSSGIYFYRLQADEFTDTRRLLFLK